MDKLIIVKELTRIEDSEGRLTPDAVVKAAQSPKSPLHRFFEWDNTEAARKYRIEQARELIREVRIEMTVHEKTIQTVAYVRDPSAPPNRQGYRSVVKLADERTEAWTAVEAEFQRALGALRRARDIATALDFADEIDRLLTDLTNLSGTLGEKVKLAA